VWRPRGFKVEHLQQVHLGEMLALLLRLWNLDDIVRVYSSFKGER
jgi:hypothetical protein